MTVAIIILALLFVGREVAHYLDFKAERRYTAEDRSYLLQRIQAPREVAIGEFVESLPPGAPSEPIWTDEDAWAALGQVTNKAAE